jgi:hypothetical protein
MEKKKNERVKKMKIMKYEIASFLITVPSETPRFSQMMSDGWCAGVTSNSWPKKVVAE